VGKDQNMVLIPNSGQFTDGSFDLGKAHRIWSQMLARQSALAVKTKKD